jgi:hypothetical protein
MNVCEEFLRYAQDFGRLLGTQVCFPPQHAKTARAGDPGFPPKVQSAWTPANLLLE